MNYLLKFNTARNALRHIIRTYNISNIFVPYYICPSIKIALRSEKVNIQFYNIDSHFLPKNNFSTNDYILYPNYFGICTRNVIFLQEKCKNLIVDNSHAFYSKPYGLASFNSLRKFFQKNYGIKNGSYLYVDNPGMFDYDLSSEYRMDSEYSYENIAKNEQKLDREPILKMSLTTDKIIKTIDFETDKKIRLDKFKYYHNMFSSKNELQFNLMNEDIPFIYPYLTHDDNESIKLQEDGFLIFRYWHNLPKTFDEYQFYRYLIPIPLL